MRLEQIKSDLVEAMQNAQPKTQPYDTAAEVVRIEGNTAWVHIPGGVDETPVALTIAAKEGDEVQVRVSGGSAWIMGNATAPPTDDKTAIAAKLTADEALEKARTAVKSTSTFYKVSYSGTDPGDVPYRSPDGEDTRSTDGEEDLRIVYPVYEWQRTVPTDVPAGMYVWTMIEIMHHDGSTAYVYSVTQTPREIYSQTRLYYLSTSSTSLSGGSWSDTLPEYVSGRYYWTRVRTLYTDNTVEYSAAVLDSANNALDQDGVFNRLTNNGTAQGLYIDESTGDVYINASYIMSGAFVITDSSGNEIFRADKTNKTFFWNMMHSALSSGGGLSLYSDEDDEDSAALSMALTSSSGTRDTSKYANFSPLFIDLYNSYDEFGYPSQFEASERRIQIHGYDENDNIGWVQAFIGGELDEGETRPTCVRVYNNSADAGFYAVGTYAAYYLNGVSLTAVKSTSLSKPSSLTNFTFGTTWACGVRKAGNTVTLRFNFNGYFTSTSTTGGTLFTLPSGYRPQDALYLNRVNQSGVRYLLTIATSGAVTLQNTSGASASSAQYFRDVISFVTSF